MGTNHANKLRGSLLGLFSLSMDPQLWYKYPGEVLPDIQPFSFPCCFIVSLPTSLLYSTDHYWDRFFPCLSLPFQSEQEVRKLNFPLGLILLAPSSQGIGLVINRRTPPSGHRVVHMWLGSLLESWFIDSAGRTFPQVQRTTQTLVPLWKRQYFKTKQNKTICNVMPSQAKQ